MGSEDPNYQRYIKPFELVESLNLSCGYEKSFKLVESQLLRNRYLIGIECEQLDRDKLTQVFDQLQMPDDFVDQFWHSSDGANLVLIGFEEGEQACTYKIYLEFWDRIQERKVDVAAPQTMFLGFKWDTEDNSRRAITDYRYFPNLDAAQIRQRIDRLEAESGQDPLFETTRAIVELSARHADGRPLIYLEASEAGNPRRSFDINLYPSGLQLRHIQPWIEQLAQHFSISGVEIERLFGNLGRALLGHLSGGVSRDGDGFFSVYYETEAGGAA